MKDMIGQPIQEDDHIIDDRGKLWVVQPTAITYQAEMLVLARERRKSGELAEPRILRLQHILKSSDELLTASPQRRKSEWYRIYHEQVHPIYRKEISERRSIFEERRNNGDGTS